MKKLLGILVLGLFLSVHANSATTKLRLGSLHEGHFNWKHKKISWIIVLGLNKLS